MKAFAWILPTRHDFSSVNEYSVSCEIRNGNVSASTVYSFGWFLQISIVGRINAEHCVQPDSYTQFMPKQASHNSDVVSYALCKSLRKMFENDLQPSPVYAQ